jgi:hypothetical protein
MAARFPSRIRLYNTGGQNPRTYSLNREGAKVSVLDLNANSRSDHVYPTVSRAKHIMNTPGLVCK